MVPVGPMMCQLEQTPAFGQWKLQHSIAVSRELILRADEPVMNFSLGSFYQLVEYWQTIGLLNYTIKLATSTKEH